MARARNIKPGFFKNDLLAECQPLARILFAGLWCEADRAGRLEDRPKRIKAECLPYDDCDIDALLNELHDRGFILRYVVGTERFIAIPAFDKHQNPHIREGASSIPAPGEHSASTVQGCAEHRTSPADSPSLIPDSPNQEKPADPAAPESPPARRSSKCTFETFLAECRAKGEKPIPADHAVFAYADDTKIPVEFIRLAWLRFRQKFAGSGKKQTGVRGWRQHFGNAVRENWFKLWWFDPDGAAQLTTAGIQAQREADAKAERDSQQATGEAA